MKRLAAHKEVHELRVFREFALAAGLGKDADLAESRPSPEPDILCRSKAGARYFELGRLTDTEHAKTVLQALRQAPKPVTPDLSKIKLPERDVLRRKLAKRYQSNGHPIELILYFDSEPRHLEGGIPPVDFAFHAQHVMVPLLAKSMGPFERVWVFERASGRSRIDDTTTKASRMTVSCHRSPLEPNHG